jgi:hypothetical protein
VERGGKQRQFTQSAIQLLGAKKVMTRAKDKRKKEPRGELLHGDFLIRTLQTLRDDCNEEIADEMFGKKR